MLENSLAIKDILLVASPLIKSLVDTFITPKLVSFRERFEVKSDSFFPTDENFQEYYYRTYKKLIIINTLVFNNSQRFLTDIYLPLTLTSLSDKVIKEKIIGFPKKLSDEFGNILITDTAGMGKSTMMKLIFLDMISKQEGIPLFIELRRLTRNKKLIDEIQEQLNAINKNFNSELLLELLSEGGFVIILDGYDEITLIDRDIVTRDLQEFISKASNNRFFITSRPEKALVSFGNFKEFKIEPLVKNEAFELLRKYDNKGLISTLLIKKLQEKELSNIEEFLTNPLLVSLLFTAFEHKQTIPFKKYLFYRQVYDANFESHDLTKGGSFVHNKLSKLEIDDFHRVLRHIGFNCFKLQRIEFSKDEILKLIKESKGFCVGLSFNESDFLHDILNTVPLFSQDGNYYRWAHKSLQEYFAAQFIYLDSKEKQDNILEKIYNHSSIEKFINVLDLYYDMDYKTFRNVIEFKLLNEYIEFCKSSYRCMSDGITNKSIVRRRELLFLADSFLYNISNDFNQRVFNHRKFEKALTEYKVKNGIIEDKFSGVISRANVRQNFGAIHYHYSKSIILNLLEEKRNSVVKKIKQLREIDFLKLELKCSFFKEYELVKLTDSKDDSFNSLENFDVTNNIIECTRIIINVIDDTNARKKIKRIKKDMEIEKESDFLLDGI